MHRRGILMSLLLAAGLMAIAALWWRSEHRPLLTQRQAEEAGRKAVRGYLADKGLHAMQFGEEGLIRTRTRPNGTRDWTFRYALSGYPDTILEVAVDDRGRTGLREIVGKQEAAAIAAAAFRKYCRDFHLSASQFASKPKVSRLRDAGSVPEDPRFAWVFQYAYRGVPRYDLAVSVGEDGVYGIHIWK